MARGFRTFLGVDLGGGKGKNTAVARLALTDGGRLEVVEVGTTRDGRGHWYDDALVDYLGAHAGAAALAIDAPLTLTACVRCAARECPGLQACADPTVAWFRTAGAALTGGAAPPHARATPCDGRSRKPATTPYTQRAAEVVLHRRHGILPRETLGQGMGPLTARAAHLTRALARFGYALHENLIEVYPKATLHQLFGPRTARGYKRRADTWEARARVLEALRGTLAFARGSRMAREVVLQNDHCFDAVVCAYTAFLWALEGWTLPAEDREVFAADGWIYAPALG